MRNPRPIPAAALVVLAASALLPSLGFAQTATYIGTQTDLTEWRTASIDKPNDPDGDDVIGTLGYHLFGAAGENTTPAPGANGPLASLPSYLTVTRNSTSEVQYAYASIDNPVDGSPATILSGTTSGSTGKTVLKIATVDFTAGVPTALTMTLMHDNLDGSPGQYNVGGYEIRASDGTTVLASINASNNNNSPDWHFITLSGLTDGDQVQIWRAANIANKFPTLGGIAFDLAPSDPSPPAWVASWPQVDGVTETGAAARGQIDEAGIAYFIVVGDLDPAPTAAEVKSGAGAVGSTVADSGSIALTANTENTAPIDGLAPATAYDVYFVAEDTVGNLQASPVKVDIATLADSPPMISTLNPADDAMGVRVGALVASFSEPIMMTAPTILHSWDFESGDDGFTLKAAGVDYTPVGSVWEHGDPDSISPGGSVSSGNTGSENGCWGTNLGLADDGEYLVPTVTCLRSPVIDLTGVVGAQLTFAEALDLEAGDTAVVNIIEDTTDTVIASAIYTADDSGSTGDADWNAVPAIDLAEGIGQKVRLEWCLTGGTPDYLGWYIDDVQVSVTSGAATITIKNLTAATETTVAVSDTSQVLIDGDALTVTPDDGFAPGTAYAIQIGNSAITDLSGNPFAGISDDMIWNFTTEAAVPLAAGSEIGIDFGLTAPTNFFNTVNPPIPAGSGSISAGSVIDTSNVLVDGVRESAGINRLGTENERVSQRRRSQSLWPRTLRRGR